MIDRWDWLSALAGTVTDELVLATYIGAPCFEWSALTDERPANAMLGKMGNTVAMAVGLALALPHRQVISIDGDGSVLLEMGVLALLGQAQPPNLRVFVVDNESYESIGSGAAGPLATVSRATVDIAAVAGACGCPDATTVDTLEDFEAVMSLPGCRFTVVKTAPARSRVPPRNVDSKENKYRFVRHVEAIEGRQVLHLAKQGRSEAD